MAQVSEDKPTLTVKLLACQTSLERSYGTYLFIKNMTRYPTPMNLKSQIQYERVWKLCNYSRLNWFEGASWKFGKLAKKFLILWNLIISNYKNPPRIITVNILSSINFNIILLAKLTSHQSTTNLRFL